MTVQPPKFFLLPEGKYNAQVVRVQFAKSKHRDYHYMCLTWEILDGPYKGMIIFEHAPAQRVIKVEHQEYSGRFFARVTQMLKEVVRVKL